MNRNIAFGLVSIFVFLSACGGGRSRVSSTTPVLTNTAEISTAKKSAEKADVLAWATWERSGGGDLMFEVSVTPAGFQAQVLRANFKPHVQMIQIDDKLLIAQLERLFGGKLTLVSRKQDPNTYGGTFTKITLVSLEQKITNISEPQITGEENSPFLGLLEKFVTDRIPPKESAETQSKEEPGSPLCEEFSPRALEGKWEEQDSSIGCGWAGTISTLHFKQANADGREVYVGSDEIHRGGIAASQPEMIPVLYRFDPKRCILEQSKAGKRTYARVKQIAEVTTGQGEPAKLELKVCTDATCSELKLDSSGNGFLHLLKKLADAQQ